jgi:phosphonate transport system substrate-binding protein
VAAVVAGLAAVVLLFVVDRGPEVTGAEIRIGLAPTIDPAILADELEPLRVYLEKTTGRPMRYVFASSYQDLQDRLLSGEVHIASLPPTLLVRTELVAPTVVPLALKLQGGAHSSDGVLLVADNSPVNDVTDLKGRVLCIPDENSTTGWILVRRALRKAGLDPDVDVKIHKSGNHLQLLRDIESGVCEAGGTYSAAYVGADNQGVNVARLRQIALTGRSPQDALVAGPGVAVQDQALVREALLAFDPKVELGIPALGSLEKISGFGKVNPADWDALREVIRIDTAAGRGR